MNFYDNGCLYGKISNHRSLGTFRVYFYELYLGRINEKIVGDYVDFDTAKEALIQYKKRLDENYRLDCIAHRVIAGIVLASVIGFISLLWWGFGHG